MNNKARILTFGIGSGLVWSVVADGLLDLFKSPGEIATVLVSGAITGGLVSFLFKSALTKCGRYGAIGFGALSLPVGAFIFGFILSTIQLVVKAVTGVGYSLSDGGSAWFLAAPFANGLMFAFVSVVSIFTIVLLPQAILTTYLLRAVIVRRR